MPARALENAWALQEVPCFHQHSFLTCHPVRPQNISKLHLSSSSLAAMAFALFEEARHVPAPCDPLTTRSTLGLKVRSRYNLSVRPPPVRTHGGLFSRLLPARSPAQAAATTTVASGRFHRQDSHPPECLASIAAFQTHKKVMQMACQNAGSLFLER